MKKGIIGLFQKGYNNILFDLKIRNKLLIVFFSFILIPIILSISINLFIVNPLLMKNTVELERRVLSQYCNDINARMRFYDTISITILGDKKLLDKLNKRYEGYLDITYAYYDYFNLISRKNNSLNNNLIRVKFYIDNPNFVYDNYFIYKQNDEFLKSDIYRELFIEGKVKGMRLAADGNILYYRILNYYHSPRRNPVLCFDISRSELLSPLSDINLTGDVFILDPKMKYLTLNGNKDEFARVQQYVQQMTKNSGIIGGSSFNDEVIIYQKAEFGWTVVKIVEPTKFFTESLYVRNLSSILIILCAVVLTGMILAISRWLTNRIKSLMDKIKHIKDGNYDSPALIAGRDEIGEASRALDGLSDDLKYLIDTVYKSKLANQKLMLDVMQARINPHFLYNTLSAIDWFLQKKEVGTSRELLNSLVHFYRCSLGSGSDVVTIADELMHLRMYLNIEKKLLGNVEADIDVPETLYPVKLIRMTLQPIVENAIKHAVRDSDDVLHIGVRGSYDGNIVTLTISDDGVGFPADLARGFNNDRTIPSKEPGSGMGLTNVDLRLRLQFGETYGLHIDEACPAGARIYVRVPLREG